jgi:hypothetical protein
MSKQKLRIIKINPYSLARMFQTGSKFEITKGIDDETILLGAGYDPNSNMFYLQIQNDKFDGIKDGDLLPPHELEIKSIDVPKV